MYSILIVEDDLTCLEMMVMTLNSEGFDVRIACDGQSGLAKVREKRPDLILCDILMPELDGYKLLETLKSDGAYVDIPFIFVTAMGDSADVRRGMSAGADDYLIKPFYPEELVSAIIGRLHRVVWNEKESIHLHGGNPTYQKEHAILREQITEREMEVLLMVGRGATSKQIATHYGISYKTVEVHRSHLMRKLNASNAADLARWAFIAEQI